MDTTQQEQLARRQAELEQPPAPPAPLPVMAVGRWRDNAALIADVARLEPAYLTGAVLDVTYGEGTFWKDYRPLRLTTSDLHKPADFAWDFTALPCEDDSWSTVVFDPDYKLNGTPAVGEMDDRYGTAENLTREQRLQKIVAGALECYRVCRNYVLVKCMDQVEGGRMRWQTDLVTRAVEDAGGVKVERFDLIGGGRPQPPRTRRCPLDTDGDGNCPACAPRNAGYPGCVDGRIASLQQHAYGRGSTLLIFQKPKGWRH